MNGIYVSPAIAALLIFYHMRNTQASRNDKRREKLSSMYERLMKMLENNQVEKGDENQNRQ